MMLHTAKPIKMPVNLDLSIVGSVVGASQDNLGLVSRIASASLLQYVGRVVWDAVKLSLLRGRVPAAGRGAISAAAVMRCERKVTAPRNHRSNRQNILHSNTRHRFQ
jgi:hypothetical protein